MKRLLTLFHAAGWVAYFSLLGFILGIMLGAAWVGKQREHAGYEKAKREILTPINHGR